MILRERIFTEDSLDYVFFVQVLVSELKADSIRIAEEVHNVRVKPLAFFLASFHVLTIGDHVCNLVFEFPIDSLQVILKLERSTILTVALTLRYQEARRVSHFCHPHLSKR